MYNNSTGQQINYLTNQLFNPKNEQGHAPIGGSPAFNFKSYLMLIEFWINH
jgi:hypothetical protein